MLNETILNQLSPLTTEEKGFLNGKPHDTSIFTGEAGDVVDWQKLLYPNTRMRARMHPRFGFYPKHRHNFVEVVYMCKGRTEHTINEKTRVELTEGNLLFINPQTYHSVEPTDMSDMALNLFVLPEFFSAAMRHLDPESSVHTFLTDCLRNTSGESPVLLFNVKSNMPIQNMLENLFWYLTVPQHVNNRMAELTMTMLLVELQNRAENLVELIPQDYDRAIIQETLDYIEQNYADGSLREIAVQLNQPPYRLSRLIRSYTGNSFTELLFNVRLRKAIDLMNSSNMSIQDIIHTVGYNNVTFFYDQFKRRTGLTPAEWRRATEQTSLS